MRYALVVLLLLLCSSCLGDDEPDKVEDINQGVQLEDPDIKSLWVCHHPGSMFHDQPCINDTFPDGCYVDGDSHKFCWLLTRKECDEEAELQSIQACNLFHQDEVQDHTVNEN